MIEVCTKNCMKKGTNFKTNERKCFFTQEIIKSWDSQPQDVMNAQTKLLDERMWIQPSFQIAGKPGEYNGKRVGYHLLYAYLLYLSIWEQDTGPRRPRVWSDRLKHFVVFSEWHPRPHEAPVCFSPAENVKHPRCPANHRLVCIRQGGNFAG